MLSEQRSSNLSGKGGVAVSSRRRMRILLIVVQGRPDNCVDSLVERRLRLGLGLAEPEDEAGLLFFIGDEVEGKKERKKKRKDRTTSNARFSF